MKQAEGKNCPEVDNLKLMHHSVAKPNFVGRSAAGVKLRLNQSSAEIIQERYEISEVFSRYVIL